MKNNIKVTQGVEILHPNKQMMETLKTVLRHNEKILEMNATIIYRINSPIFSIKDDSDLTLTPEDVLKGLHNE